MLKDKVYIEYHLNLSEQQRLRDDILPSEWSSRDLENRLFCKHYKDIQLSQCWTIERGVIVYHGFIDNRVPAIMCTREIQDILKETNQWIVEHINNCWSATISEAHKRNNHLVSMYYHEWRRVSR